MTYRQEETPADPESAPRVDGGLCPETVTSTVVAGLPSLAWNDLQCLARRFEQQWSQGQRPELEEFLPADPAIRRAALLELIYTELELRLKSGDRARAADYLIRYPEIGDDPRLLHQLAATEARWSRARTDNPGPSPLGTGSHQRSQGPIRPGRYELLEEIGRGSFGVVHRAWDSELGRHVAIKVPRPGRIVSAQETERFLREARLAARLNHPSIVPVHDAGRSDDTCYIVSEFIPGSNLADRLATGPLPPRVAAELVRQVATGLECAHGQGIIHRDLKPSNIIIDLAGKPRLTDFGLAKHDRDEATLTVEGEVLGTPAYLSPEQARGEGHSADARSDVYSLGVILYHALTGEPPFRGNIRMVLDQVQNDIPRAPRRLNDLIPRDLETICLKAMDKEPHRRYRSAGDLADDLARFLDGRPILARPTPRWEHGILWARRRPAIAALILTCAVSTLLGFLGISWQWRQAVAARELAAARAESESQTREALEVNLYHHRIALADRELEAGNEARMEELLDQCPSEARGWEWYHLKRKLSLRDKSVRTLDDGTRVFDVAFSRDGSLLASAGWDGKARVREVASGRLIRTIDQGREPIHTVEFSPDGGELLTCDGDGSVVLWDVAAGRRRQTWRGHREGVWDATFSPDGTLIASGDNRGSIIVRRADTGDVAWSRDAHADRIWDLDFSPDGLRLASASADGHIKLWDVHRGTELLELDEGMEFPVFCMAFSPDGARLASSGASGVLKLWDATDGRLLSRTRLSTLTVESLAFHPDGSRIAFAGNDQIITICDATSGQGIVRLYGHTHGVWGLAFSPDGTMLASGSWDESIRIWSAREVTSEETPELLVFRGHDGVVFDVKYDPRGGEIASAGDDGIIRLWDPSTGKERLGIRGHRGGITSLAYSPDGLKIASSSWDRTVRLWDTSTGAPLAVLRGHTAAIFNIVYSPDGNLIATAGWDRTARVWEVATATQIQVYPDELGFCMDVAISPDGKLLATAGNRRVRIWDLKSRRLLKTIDAETETVISLAFTPDGSGLAFGGRDGRVRLWDIRSGKTLLTLEIEQRAGRDLCFAPDGSCVITAGENRKLIACDVKTGERIFELAGHQERLFSMSFSPDSRRIASSGGDQTVRIWRVPEYPNLSSRRGK